MKIAVIGGGSTYTPELFQGLLAISKPGQAKEVPIREVWLMDIDADRLETVGRFVQRLVEHSNAPFQVYLTLNRREALQDAAYVITQFRVGKMPARREDEYLGIRHGLVGQETTGVGGFAKALRTIPVLIDVARDMQEVAKEGMLINFTNPSGLVTEAISRNCDIPSIGLCNAPIGRIMSVASQLDLDPKDITLDYLGLNHLAWVRGASCRGEDLWPEVFKGFLANLHEEENPLFPPKLIAILGLIPSSYLQYFYNTRRIVAEQARAPRTRAEEVMVIERELLNYYQNTDNVEIPPGLMKRGGAYYSTAATSLISSLHHGGQDFHILNVPHQGAVDGWPYDWVLEIPCRVDVGTVRPIPTEPLAGGEAGLLHVVKSYELLAVEAAVQGDRELAVQALAAHPLGPDADKVAEVFDDLLHINAEYLPQFGNRDQK